MKKSLTHAIAYALVCALAHPPLAPAQTADNPPAASALSPPAEKIFNQEELDQMLAPLALYPDALLSQTLMAATYPLEVVEAARWVKQYPGLTGAALQDALAAQSWDASVKSLCAFPQVLDRMSRDLAWMQKIGDAFIDQQLQVMDTVQNLRRRAQAAGTLRSNAQQLVESDDGDITIASVNPQVLYIPTYDPAVVYGRWSWPAYPPYYPAYWGPPGGAVMVDGFFWGVGIAAGLALWGGFNWRRHDVDINVGRYNDFNRTHLSDNHWQFDPAHRGGVPYRSIGASQRFGRFDQRAAQAREAFRGRGSVGPAARSGVLNIDHGAQARSFAGRGYASMGHSVASAHSAMGMARGGGGGHFGGGNFGGGGHGSGGHR